MSEHNDFGKEAENKAAEFYINLGYTILERNYRYLKSEIDFIALKDSKLCIVEVKARQSNQIQDPESAVTRVKMKLLINAANHFIISNDLDVDAQFDIVSIIKNSDKWNINVIENAFLASDVK